MHQLTKLKNLFLATMAVASMSLNAQIPNAGFETWKTSATEQIGSWNTFGPVSKTGNGTGGTAVKLQNNPGTGDFGIVSMVNYDTGDFFAPYYSFGGSQAPDSVIFRVNIQLGIDTASVILGFTKSGEDFPLISNQFRFTGNVGWQTFTFPLEYVNTTPSLVPDSAYAAIFSANETDGPSASGYIEFDYINFKLSNNSPEQAMPNNSFETWVASSVEYPEDWVTSTQLTWLQTNAGNNTSKSTESFSGNFALEVTPAIIADAGSGIKDTLPGFCLSLQAGDSPEKADIFKPAFAVDQRYTSFRGWLKTDLGAGDMATIWVNMYSNGNIVGSAYSNDGTSHGYQEFSVDFVWDTAFSGIPDSVSIGLYVSDSSMSAANYPLKSRALFDDLRFDNWNSSIQAADLLITQVFPNPASGNCRLQIETNNPLPVHCYLYDAGGRLIQSSDQRGTGIFTINVFNSDVKPGLYWLEVQQGKSIQKHKIILTP